MAATEGRSLASQEPDDAFAPENAEVDAAGRIFNMRLPSETNWRQARARLWTWFWVLVIFVSLGCAVSSSRLSVVDRDSALILLSNGVVVDLHSRLMWPAKDNGQDISFEQAKEYVHTFRLAGYDDWRFPTLQELETLLVEGAGNDTPPGQGCYGGYDMHPFIRLTCCCPWALEDNGTRAASFPFIPGMAAGTMWHHNSGGSGNRVLPVRHLEYGWQPPEGD